MGAIPSTSLGETEGHVKGLWYGPAKQGKTTALAGAARLGRMVVVDIEGEGWLARPLRKRGIPVENIVKYTATTFEEMTQVYWEIKGMFDDCDVAGTPELAPVAVAVDHLSELESRLVTIAREKRTGKIRKPLEAKIASGNQDAQAALDDLNLNLFKSERDDYGVWTNQARDLMRKFRDLPCHVGFAALYRTDEYGMRVPGLTEKFRMDLMGSMNVVIGCTIMEAGGEPAYVGYTQESKQHGWYGGDRFDALRPITVNPSFDRVIAATQGKLDLAEDAEQLAFKRALES